MVHQLSLRVLAPLLCVAIIQHYASAWTASPATTTRVARATTPARSSPLFSQAVIEPEGTLMKKVKGACPVNMKKGDVESAKSLLKKYGMAYLATSISLSICSMSTCYFCVKNGVNVGALLAKLGLSAGAGKAGTFAVAYAAHKAASPLRFPPTVVLSKYTAKLIGKEPPKVVNISDQSVEDSSVARINDNYGVVLEEGQPGSLPSL